MILPVALRRALQVQKGDKVVIRIKDDHIELTTPQRARRRAQERFRRLFPGDRSIVDEFITEKREEAQCDNDDLATPLQSLCREPIKKSEQ